MYSKNRGCLTLNISTLCPTRGRPLVCEKMIRSWIKNTYNSELCIYVQDDDLCLDDYKIISKKYTKKINWVFGPRYSTGMMWNILYENHSNAPIIHLGSDDLHFNSQKWDVFIKDYVRSFSDQVYCLSVMEDNVKSAKACRHPIVSKKMCDALGYFYPPMFMHYQVDHWHKTIAKKVNRFFTITDIQINHVRDSANSEFDWRQEYKTDGFSTSSAKTMLHNSVYKRDKYSFDKLDRHIDADVDVLKKLIGNKKI